MAGVLVALGAAADVVFAVIAAYLALRFIAGGWRERQAGQETDQGKRKLATARARTIYALAAFQNGWMAWSALLAALAKIASILLPAITMWLTPPAV